jgi:formate hydrogenlyase transcriptional activator
VRELENILERAIIVAGGDHLHVDPIWLTSPAMTPRNSNPSVLADVERRTILEALQRTQGRIYGPAGAAQALGLKPSTLYGKMRKYRIATKSSRFGFEE